MKKLVNCVRLSWTTRGIEVSTKDENDQIELHNYTLSRKIDGRENNSSLMSHHPAKLFSNTLRSCSTPKKCLQNKNNNKTPLQKPFRIFSPQSESIKRKTFGVVHNLQNVCPACNALDA
ncbi:hypothetical protein QTP88_015804 [Uroleucon formosanum]